MHYLVAHILRYILIGDTLQRVRLFLKCFIAHLLRLKLNRDIPPTATGLPPWVCPVFYTDQGDTSVCVDLPQQL